MPTEEMLLRPATPDDLPALADLYVASRAAAGAGMPPSVHGDEEVRAWVCGWDLDAREAWLAERDGTPLGFAVVVGSWLEMLHVDPGHAGSGVGSALLEVVKGLRPDGFGLWVFASNGPARSFYAHRGLLELELTDGSLNEERAPDVRMAWPGRDPVAYLRGQIDEADDELGRLLARRFALTHAVQQHKEVPGPAGRDAERERQIAERIARHVPELGPQRLARIVHSIITESLDADL